jgi:hypothetical protein
VDVFAIYAQFFGGRFNVLAWNIFRLPLGRQFSVVCTENLIRVDDAMESPKLVE